MQQLLQLWQRVTDTMLFRVIPNSALLLLLIVAVRMRRVCQLAGSNSRPMWVYVRRDCEQMGQAHSLQQQKKRAKYRSHLLYYWYGLGLLLTRLRLHARPTQSQDAVGERRHLRGIGLHACPAPSVTQGAGNVTISSLRTYRWIL